MACRVPFAFLLTFFMLLAALIPAVIIWAIMYTTVNDSMDMVTTVSTSTITQLSSSLQGLLIADSLSTFAAHLEEAAAEVETLIYFLASHNLDQRDLTSSPNLLPSILGNFSRAMLSCMKAHDFFSFIDLDCGQGYSTNRGTPRSAWAVFQALNYDMVDNLFERTIYLSALSTNVYNNVTQLESYYINQVTAQQMFRLSSDTFSAQAMLRRPMKAASWYTDISFNQLSGQAEVYYETTSYLALHDSYYDLTLAVNTQTVSEELKARVANNTRDRLFIIFRQPHGHMLGASHGKFYSQSNVDSRLVNPITNPPNMSLLYAYTCLDSDDSIIYEACTKLYVMSGKNWSNVPLLSTEMTLEGAVYWVNTGFSSDGFDCTMVALKYKAEVMGQVDSQIAAANSYIEQKRVWTYVVLGIASFLAILIPCAIGWWLAVQLAEIRGRLHNAEKLNFSDRAATYSIFTELQGVQNACTQMEQSLLTRLLLRSGGQRPVVWVEETEEDSQ